MTLKMNAGRDRGDNPAERCSPWVGARQPSWLVFLCLVALMPRASAQTASAAPPLQTIIARMARARAENQARFRAYVVTRDYTLFGKERHEPKSQVTVNVTFVPPDSKKYAIQQSNGTGLGERIVRRMLAGEAQIAKDYLSTDFSPDNYDFKFFREEQLNGRRCYALELLPRRLERSLLSGIIWVDAQTYLLQRTEGAPAKKPSWWLRDVRIVLLYGGVGGMWLQTSSEATATVWVLGQHTMAWRDMKYSIGELVAAGPKQAFKLDSL